MANSPFSRKRRDIQFALDAGWVYQHRSSKGHLVFVHPGGGPKLIMSSNLGEGRGAENAISWIRKNTPTRGTSV